MTILISKFRAIPHQSLPLFPIQTIPSLSLHIRLCPADVLLELEEPSGELDVRLQEVLRVLAVCAGVAGVLLDVQADGGARATGARQADNDARAVGELHVQALLR